jgi:hypothetical protein
MSWKKSPFYNCAFCMLQTSSSLLTNNNNNNNISYTPKNLSYITITHTSISCMCIHIICKWYCKQYYTREYITIITRLRIGHGNYPDHLHILILKEDNLCECGSEGTLDHIFFNCHLHEEATAQLNLAIENLDLTIDNPRSLTHLLRLNTKQIHDLLVNFIKQDDITI